MTVLSCFAFSGDIAMPVQMELSRIVINDINEQQVIFLKEVEGERSFPILIGPAEASSIDRHVKGLPFPRPNSHDLLVSVAEHLGGEPHSVEVSELREHTYYAKLKIMQEGELVQIDSRPSDAIAVAVTCTPQLPIYVSEDVLNDVMDDQGFL